MTIVFLLIAIMFAQFSGAILTKVAYAQDPVIFNQETPPPALQQVASVPVTAAADGVAVEETASAPPRPTPPASDSSPGASSSVPPAEPVSHSELDLSAKDEPLPALGDILQSANAAPPEVPRRFQDMFAQLSSASSGPALPAETEKNPAYNVPIVVNPRVEGHMRFFHTSIRDRFEQWLVRLGRYKKQVEEIFAEFNLPSDLVFLSLVESGFNPHAFSRARATGPWQFMSGTAKNYGLRVDQYIDERRDPIKSTIAAAQYLRDLYDMFGTWPLAMAAYNAGEGKVMRALQKAQATSYWEIAQTKHLKKETKEYVPRFMAATIIAKNPDRFGFPQVESTPHEFEEVVVSRSLHLRDIASTTGIPFDELDRLNPELRRSVTPPGEAYHLKIPVGAKETVEPLIAQVKAWTGPLPKAKGESSRKNWYRVKVGDSLQKIAARFKVSIPELKSMNHLRGGVSLKPGQRLRISQ